MILSLSISVKQHAQMGGGLGRAGSKINIIDLHNTWRIPESDTRLGVISSARYGLGGVYPGHSLPRAMTPDGS